MRLAQAHIDLARAEFGEILEHVKVIAAGIGVAIAFGLYALLLSAIGITLFIGEWLFGSIGWGILHGIEFSIAIAIVGVLVALYFPLGIVLRGFLVGLVVGILVGIVFGLNLTHQAWVSVGENSFPSLAPETRPLVLAAVIVGGIFAVLGLIVGVRAGGLRGAIGGLFAGALLGAFLGMLTALDWNANDGAAFGVAIGLAVWSIVMGYSAARRGVDVEALKARLYPSQTIDTTMETIEWVRQQTPLGRKS
jgi:hypothetical protein